MAAKSYNAKVASLTSERVGLQAQIKELTEEFMKHMSNLKHASVARERAEDKEKEACTQWASGWLTFQCRSSRAFPDLDFNIQLSDEKVEGFDFEAEVDAGAEVFLGAPDSWSLALRFSGSSRG